MNIGSLFSGTGGLDMAVEQVFPGAAPAWFCEWDDAPSRILAHHWPDVPNLRDVTAVDWESVRPVDIITGGFPCQDVSHAGRRDGLIRDGEGRTRSGLWGQMLRAIDTIRPPLVVAENVRGLLSATADSDVEPCPWCMGDGGASPMRALGAVLADLADIGFDASWTSLRAADVGAAHGRFRVFILAWPVEDVPTVVPDSDGARGEGCPGRGVQQGRQSDGGGAGDVSLLPTPTVNDAGNAGGPAQFDRNTVPLSHALLPTPRATDGTKGGPNQRGSSGGLMLPSAVHLLPTPNAQLAHGSQTHRSGARSHELLLDGISAAGAWGDYAPAIARWESTIGRDAPAPTEPGAKGNPRLSPRFVEWLMGLPAGHVTDPAIGLTRNQQLKALGNGVVPQQGAAALEWLLSDLAVVA